MKVGYIVLIFSLLASSASWAQQDPVYSQYLSNPFLLNPAYAGLNNSWVSSISYRKQWAGFDGSPTTVNINSHISLMDNKVGAGMLFTSDNLGTSTNTEFQLAGSYRLVLDDKIISFGMQAGILNFRSNYSTLNLADPIGDPAFMTNENISKPTIGAGVILKSDKYMVGISVPRMLSAAVSNGGQSFELYSQHFYFFGGYVFYLSDRVRLKPSVLLRGVSGAPLSTDVNVNFTFENKYSAGLFTRNFATYGILVQAWLNNNLRLAYTFEMPTASSVGTRFSTSELSLTFKTSILALHDPSISNF